MSDFPTSAKCVVIGAGIVGNCLVGHLARLGWTDLVLLDKGPLPNPGGSTGHASNFIFPVDHNKEMALLGEQSANQYRDLGLSVDSGGIEVARTEERMHELERRMTSAKAWGIEAHLLTPAEVKELVPFVNDDVILGGFYCPTVSVVDFTAELEKEASAEELNAAFTAAAEGPMKGILGVETDKLVSMDFKGDERSSIIDAPSTMSLGGNFVKVLAWYDNEWGYSCRVADLVKYMIDRL